MDGERDRIRKMFEEGKISPEEARRLIEALEKTGEDGARQAPALVSGNGGKGRARVRLYAALVVLCVLVVSSALALYRAGYLSQGPAQRDLLLNGGFETGAGEKVSIWVPSVASDPFWGGDSGGGVFFRDDSVAYKGSHSVAITGTVQGGPLSWRQRLKAFPAGRKLVLTGYVRTSGVSGAGASLAIRGLKELGGETFVSSSSMSFDLTGTGDWTKVRVYAVVVEGTREIEVLCQLDGAGTAWFDELRLTVDDSITPP